MPDHLEYVARHFISLVKVEVCSVFKVLPVVVLDSDLKYLVIGVTHHAAFEHIQRYVERLKSFVSLHPASEAVHLDIFKIYCKIALGGTIGIVRIHYMYRKIYVLFRIYKELVAGYSRCRFVNIVSMKQIYLPYLGIHFSLC